MDSPRIEIGKTTAVLSFIIKCLPSPTLRKVLAILYFAEQKKMAAWGHRILENDHYIKMEPGPVPSKLYDRLKEAKGEKTKLPEWKPFYDAIVVTNNFHLSIKKNPNMDFLSKWDIEFLAEAIEETTGKTADQLSRQSHDSAWNSVEMGAEIDILEIAKAGGADKDTLNYIEENEAISMVLSG